MDDHFSQSCINTHAGELYCLAKLKILQSLAYQNQESGVAAFRANSAVMSYNMQCNVTTSFITAKSHCLIDIRQ